MVSNRLSYIGELAYLVQKIVRHARAQTSAKAAPKAIIYQKTRCNALIVTPILRALYVEYVRRQMPIQV